MLNIIKKHLEDLAAGKWREYEAALATNVVYEEPATRMRVVGAAEYVNAVKRWKTAFPDLRAEDLKLYEAGDTVIAELMWAGTHEGKFEGPFGTIAPTFKKGGVKAVLVCKLKGEKIVEARNYFDVFTILAQLGIAPPIAATMGQQPVATEPRTRH